MYMSMNIYFQCHCFDSNFITLCGTPSGACRVTELNLHTSKTLKYNERIKDVQKNCVLTKNRDLKIYNAIRKVMDLDVITIDQFQYCLL